MFKNLLGKSKVILIAAIIILASRWIDGISEGKNNQGINNAPTENTDRKISTNPNNSNEPLAVYTQSPSNGMKKEDFNISYATSLETGATESLREKYSRNYKNASGEDIEPSSLEVISRSAITEISGKSIIIVTTKIRVLSSESWKPQGMFVRLVMLDGRTLHQVTCVGTGPSDFNVWSGTCGEKIQQSFGIVRPNL